MDFGDIKIFQKPADSREDFRAYASKCFDNDWFGKRVYLVGPNLSWPIEFAPFKVDCGDCERIIHYFAQVSEALFGPFLAETAPQMSRNSRDINITVYK